MPFAKDLVTATIAIVLMTIVLGVAYPLVVTGAAQVAFPGRADGSLVRDDGGKVVGSRLIGLPRLRGKRPDPGAFQPRPSATGYSATATYFSNAGPNAKDSLAFYRGAIKDYLALNGRYSPGLTRATIPIDAVTTSASGVDPHISEANARIQARRVAAVRGLALPRVAKLVAGAVDGRFLGVFGEPGVNVTALNLALDRETR